MQYDLYNLNELTSFVKAAPNLLPSLRYLHIKLYQYHVNLLNLLAFGFTFASHFDSLMLSINDFKDIELSPDDDTPYSFYNLSAFLLKRVQLPHGVSMTVAEPRVTHCVDFITYSKLLTFRNRTGFSFTLKLKREWTGCTLDNTEPLQLALQNISHLFMTVKGPVDYQQFSEELDDGICSW